MVLPTDMKTDWVEGDIATYEATGTEDPIVTWMKLVGSRANAVATEINTHETEDGAHTAGQIEVADVDDLFTGDTVETILAEIMNVAVFLAGAVNQMARGKEMFFGNGSILEGDLVHNLGSEYVAVTLYEVATGLRIEDNEGVATDADTWHVGPLDIAYPSDGVRAVFLVAPA